MLLGYHDHNYYLPHSLVDRSEAVPLLQFIFVYISVIATVPLCLVIVSSLSHLLSLFRKGCASSLCDFLGNYIYIYLFANFIRLDT